MIGTTLFLGLLSVSAQTLADDPPSTGKNSILAPGYGTLSFQAPAAGSYDLPGVGVATDGAVLDTQGRPLRLHQLMGDKVVLLSFIYSTCSDVNGCPLATAVLHRVKKRLEKTPELAGKLRLLTLSFNPQHDTPEVMRAYAQGLQATGVDWRFLTTASEAELQPILEQYQQTVRKDYDEQGQQTGTYSHVLRVYLIDPNKQLRNIYSVAFLHADTLINDVKTLLLERENRTTDNSEEPALYRAGDDKSGYQHSAYATRSIALKQRRGQSVDLLNYANQPQLGLPRVPVPADNPLTTVKIQLGRKLFYDRRLSLNKTFSCAMCHIPEQGFTSHEMATAVGVEGRTVRRNTPTLYNIAYARLLFHDGRENSLEQQVWGPLLARNEMANPSIGYVVNTIKQLPDYKGLFEAAFQRGAGMETIGMALASYQRSLNAADSPFDRWYFSQDSKAISASAQRGYQLFTGRAGCVACHLVGKDDALFMDQQLHNTGIGYLASMGKNTLEQRVQLAPGIFMNVEKAIIASVSEPKPNDLGRYEITQNPADRWRYKTPTLRNITLTAPYMHDGSLPDLASVVSFYNKGGVSNDGLDTRVQPLNLSQQEQADLVEFMQTLTSDSINTLVADAYAAPVGE